MHVLGLIIIALIVIGGIVWFWQGKGDAPETAQAPTEETAVNMTPAEEETADETGVFAGTLSDLLKRGGNQQCAWSYNEGGADLSGTTYVSGKRFAGESELGSKGANMKMSMVGDGTTMHTWFQLPGTNQMMGTKMSYTDMENAGNDTSISEQERQQVMQKFNYRCESWKVDESKFQVPTNVTFSAS